MQKNSSIVVNRIKWLKTVCMCIAHCQKQMYKTFRSVAILCDKTVAKKIAKCAALTTIAVKNKCEVVLVVVLGFNVRAKPKQETVGLLAEIHLGWLHPRRAATVRWTAGLPRWLQRWQVLTVKARCVVFCAVGSFLAMPAVRHRLRLTTANKTVIHCSA